MNYLFGLLTGHYSSLTYSAERDSKTLFRTITRFLFTRKQINLFHTNSSAVDHANKFVHFFEEKIVNIRSNLGSPVIPDFFRTLTSACNFSPTSNTELSIIANIIMIMKSCFLDPLSATLLKQHFDLLLGSLRKSLRRPLLRRSWMQCPGQSTSRSSPKFKLGSCSIAFAIIYQQQNSMVVN